MPRKHENKFQADSFGENEPSQDIKEQRIVAAIKALTADFVLRFKQA